MDRRLNPARRCTTRRPVDIVAAIDALTLKAKEMERAPEGSELVQPALEHLGVRPGVLHDAWTFDGRAGLTLGALLVLRAAASAERRGETAEEALRRATETLHRYVDLLPLGLAPTADRPTPSARGPVAHLQAHAES